MHNENILEGQLSHHTSVHYLVTKESVLFQLLFSEFTLYYIIIRCLNQVYHFSLLTCYTLSSLLKLGLSSFVTISRFKIFWKEYHNVHILNVHIQKYLVFWNVHILKMVHILKYHKVHILVLPVVIPVVDFWERSEQTWSSEYLWKMKSLVDNRANHCMISNLRNTEISMIVLSIIISPRVIMGGFYACGSIPLCWKTRAAVE